MSLDIGIAAAKTTTPDPAESLRLDDNGYYWFCYPFFKELCDRTGEMIDLYGDASFAGAELDALSKALGEIRAKANEMPEEWQVCIGHNPDAPLFSLVQRDRLLGLLTRFEDLVLQARRDATWVVCFGD